MKSQSDRISHSAQSNLLRRLRTSARNMAIGVQLAGTIGLLGVTGSFSFGQAVSAQTPIPITGISTTSSNQTQEDYSTTTANPCDNATAKVFACNTTAKIVFGSGTNDNLNLDSVTAGGTTFSYRGLADKIQIKRVNNPQISSDRQIIFFQNNSATNASTIAPIAPITFNVAPSRVDTMESALLSQTINRGADNVFANDAPATNKSKNYNNIERIDYIINNGLAAATILDAADIGFVVMDRGGNDRYAIAPILSLDGSGNPATVGAIQVFTINSPLAPTAQDYLVLRREDTSLTSLLRPSDRSGSQPIGGHFVPLSKLFLTPYIAGTKVYGYVLMAPDAPTTSTAVVSLTGFPSNSEANNSTGGIDLIAGGGIFSKDPLPSNNTYTLAGNVFDDASGNKLKEVTESSVNGTTLALNAVLIGSNNIVVATTPVSATGTYTFSNVAAGTYTVRITTNTGATASTIALPNNWVTTGENLNGTIDTTADSIQSITVVAANITNIDFGIEQLPTAKTTNATPQPNPTGTNSVAVPINLFNTSTDPDNGTVTQYRITSFPTNATSIEINGVVYTVAGGNSTTAFPTTTGVAVLALNLNTIKVDPDVDGAVNVSIPFKAIDNAGKESTNTADAIVPFTAGNKPELILLKRITKINGLTTGKTTTGAPIDLTQVVANPATPASQSADASNPNWPTVNYPQGAIDAGAIKSGDTIEYTIYFLSNGKAPVTNANFCDWVPKNTTFVPDSYGVGQGIQLAIGSLLNTFTNVPDGDRGVFYNPGATPPATYPNANTFKLNCMSPAGTEGAVVVNLVNNTLTAPENQLPNATAAGTPGNSYGLVRFVSKVK